MEKLIHFIFWVFCSASCAAENITVVYGMEGGSISVNCTYDPWQQRWREKSWCRQLEEKRCDPVVSARPFWLPFPRKRNGTTSIRDNIHQGVLTVTMEQLKKQDAGLYQCKSSSLGETRSLRKVQVEVLTAVLETQMPEEPSAVQGTSSISSAGSFSAFSIIAVFLAVKFMVALLIFITVLSLSICNSWKKRETEQEEPSWDEQQVLPLDAARDGISPSWGSTA
ncbi:triggering receptor expressed on myeloid cells 2 [Calypte anna]|uniref:triggering receptor expressed on myeloid cells 2 n=1 Tax=Calypte anna TaxID=9244 RepID=UPI0011C3CFF9|nr:triggering receptor expressed on myeloid cells 2 [Calypte anna]